MAPRQMVVELDRLAVIASLEEQLKKMEAEAVNVVKNNAAEKLRYTNEHKAWVKEVKAIVAKHDGEFQVDSRGYGSSLSFTAGGLFPKPVKPAYIQDPYIHPIEHLKRTITKVKMIVGATVPSTLEGLSQFI